MSDSVSNAFLPINIANLKPISINPSAVRRLSDEEVASFQSRMNPPSPPPPTAAQIEAAKPYAEIVKDGKVVGKVSRGGYAETSNSLGARLMRFFETTDDRDARAAAIAKAAGGTIRYI